MIQRIGHDPDSIVGKSSLQMSAQFLNLFRVFILDLFVKIIQGLGIILTAGQAESTPASVCSKCIATVATVYATSHYARSMPKLVVNFGIPFGKLFPFGTTNELTEILVVFYGTLFI